MAFTEPYKQNVYIVYPGDVRKRKLSFALWLIDKVTKGRPVGNINVQIKEMNKKAIKNLSGYYLFVDLDPGKYTVNIDSDYYDPIETEVDTSTFTDTPSFPNIKNPVIEITLNPTPSYPSF